MDQEVAEAYLSRTRSSPRKIKYGSPVREGGRVIFEDSEFVVSQSGKDSISGQGDEIPNNKVIENYDPEKELESINSTIAFHENMVKEGGTGTLSPDMYQQLLSQRTTLGNEILMQREMDRRDKEEKSPQFQSDLDFFGMCPGGDSACKTGSVPGLFHDAKASAKNENREILTESLSEFEALQRNSGSNSTGGSSGSSGGGRIVLVVDALTTVSAPLHTETIKFDGKTINTGGDGLFTVFTTTIDASCPSGATKTFEAVCNPNSGFGAACRYQFKSLSGASCSLAVGAGPIIITGGQTSSQTCTCN